MKNKDHFLSFVLGMAASLSISIAASHAQSRLDTIGDVPRGHQSLNTVRLSREASAPVATIKFADSPPTSNLHTPFQANQVVANENYQPLVISTRLTDISDDAASKSERANVFRTDSVYLMEETRSRGGSATVYELGKEQSHSIVENQSISNPNTTPTPQLIRGNGTRLRPVQNNFSSVASVKSSSAVNFRSNPLRPIRPVVGQTVEKTEATEAESELAKQINNEQVLANRTAIESPLIRQDDGDESSLLSSFPAADLHSGIQTQSFKRASTKRVINDPNYQFLTSAHQAPLTDGDGSMMWKTWESPNVRYRPLWFEEENLERYGQHAGHYIQPYVSGLHFFGGVVMLPYKLASEGTDDCEYGLGYYRPGNCNPAFRKRINCSGRGLILQTLTVGGILVL